MFQADLTQNIRNAVSDRRRRRQGQIDNAKRYMQPPGCFFGHQLPDTGHFKCRLLDRFTKHLQVKKGGVMASSYVGGLSGAFIPVSEDQGMIDAVTAGALTLEKLEAMTCVCSVGLDMIAIPGDTKATTISGIIADEMAIGMINQKTTAVRLIPVIGKGVGETVEFGGLLGYAPIMPVNPFSCDAFVNRGGRIPAPIHSFKN